MTLKNAEPVMLPEDRNDSVSSARIFIRDMSDWLSIVEYFRFHYGWYFRGQSRKEWIPNSGMERLLNTAFLYTDQKRREYEIAYLTKEQQNIAQFEIAFPSIFRDRTPPSSKVGMLSLMQHYGLPTRLLDFSQNIYVSMFMASERQTPDIGFSIWCVDSKRLRLESPSNMELEHILSNPPNEVVKEFSEQKARVLLITDQDAYEGANRRIKPQCGLFLSYDRLAHPPFGAVSRMMGMGSIIDIWARSLNWLNCGLPPALPIEQIYQAIYEHPIIEFVFPVSSRLQMLDIAESNGATKENLFPDLELNDEVGRLIKIINFNSVFHDPLCEWM